MKVFVAIELVVLVAGCVLLVLLPEYRSVTGAVMYWTGTLAVVGVPLFRIVQREAMYARWEREDQEMLKDLPAKDSSAL